MVIPALNEEDGIADIVQRVGAVEPALRSVGVESLEIIVVDDGSRDATGELLDDYASRCRTHLLTVVHQANAGAHEAINHGLALARGDVTPGPNGGHRPRDPAQG